jgi:hypothetical protein
LGRDILYRMGQLEQKSKESNNRPLFSSKRSSNVPDHSPLSSNPVRHSMPVNSTMLQPKAAPNLSITSLHSKAHDDRLEDESQRPPSPSICHSPTWEKDVEKSKDKERSRDRRKLEKERISLDLRKQKEEDSQNHNPPQRQGKRLSKKPPPAMQTQRQAAGLAYPTTQDSQENIRERRPSSSGSIGAAVRGFLSRRNSSSSQPQTPDSSRPTSKRGRSDSIGPKGGRGHSRSSTFEKFSSDDDAYVKDLVDFAYQMGESAKKALENPSLDTKPRKRLSNLSPSTTHAPPPQPPATTQSSPSPLLDAAQEPDPVLLTPASPSLQTNTVGNRPGATRSRTVPTSFKQLFGKRDNAQGGYRYPDFNKLRKDPPLENPATKSAASRIYKSLHDFRTKSAPNVNTGQSASQEHLGYVQRERFNQQQRSIARYQDELAVKSACDLLVMKEEEKEEEEEEEVEQSASLRATTDSDKTRKEKGSEIRTGEENDPRRPVVSKRNSRKLVADPGNTASQKESKPALVSRKTSDEAKPDLSPGKQSNESQSKRSEESIAPKRNARSLLLGIGERKESQKQPPVSSPDRQSYFQLPPLPRASTSPIFPTFGESTADHESPTRPEKPIKPNQPTPTVSSQKTEPREEAELIISGTNAEGIVRKTSVKRPRSDPELKVPELNVEPKTKSNLPSFDFLPELKHQPLTKPKRTSKVSFAPGTVITKASLLASQESIMTPSPKFPASASATDLSDMSLVTQDQSSPTLSSRSTALRSRNRVSAGPGTLISASGVPAKPIAKLFVICCKCKFWHDLPSRIYEAMALPQTVNKEDDIAKGIPTTTNAAAATANTTSSANPIIATSTGSGSTTYGKKSIIKGARPGSAGGTEPNNPIGINHSSSGGGGGSGGNSSSSNGIGSSQYQINDMPEGEVRGLEGKIFTEVKCPWCDHGMSTRCCAGWTAVIYLHERHH